MKSYNIYTPAKINLTLDVKYKRPDSYHEFESVMQSISLYDKLTVTAETENPDGEIVITCNDQSIPTNESNIIYKAAEAFCKASGKRCGLKIHLEKKIPYDAGLGGGSGNGAGIIKLLNRIFGDCFGLPELCDISKSVGADIPFFLYGGTCVARGIGEKITEIKCDRKYHYLIVKPPFGVSTAECYNVIDNCVIEQRPDTSGMVKSLESGSYIAVGDSLCNVMETAVKSFTGDVDFVKTDMIKAGAHNAIMTGSGSAVFGIFENAEKVMDAAEKMKKHGKVFCAETCGGIIFEEVE